MDVGRYLVEAHLKEGRSVASLARDHGLHRSWIYKLLARYREEGEAGLVLRSRRPHSSPTAVSEELEDRIVEIRKELFKECFPGSALIRSKMPPIEPAQASRAPSVPRCSPPGHSGAV